jgi:hypothetical protein
VSRNPEFKLVNGRPRSRASYIMRVRLRPGPPLDDGDYFRETTFSMFGNPWEATALAFLTDRN